MHEEIVESINRDQNCCSISLCEVIVLQEERAAIFRRVTIPEDKIYYFRRRELLCPEAENYGSKKAILQKKVQC